jgi:NAD(P)-dependent dehydrogenase (short-subunit alcohol dehydrogenase family)
MKRLEGKVAMITGGTGGLGEATSLLFAAEGAKIAIVDRDQEKGDRLAARIRGDGGQAGFFRVDIAKAAEVERCVGAIVETFGALDILVNNAAVTGTASPTHEATEAEFDAVFAVNVKGTFLCTKHAMAHMLPAGRGSIVNISSTYGVVGNADIPLYHATKAAVRLLAKSDAVTYAGRGIRVNSVLPGSIRTPMAVEAARINPDGENYLKNLIAQHPMGRQAEPIEIARAVLFLASDEASFITGVDLPVDGGYTAQ